MTRKDELLAAYDDALNYECESIQLALRGVTEEEASYQDPIYQDEPARGGYPLPGTILWQLTHLANCYREYEAMVVDRPAEPPSLPPLKIYTLADAKAVLELHRKELCDALASIPEEQLDELLCNGHSIAQHIRMSIRHDAWHMSQVVMARRMYRKRPR